MKVAIGIDLGTTFSCVGVWQNGKVEIISNDQGNRTTPSFVAFTETDHLVGDAAKNQVAGNPLNTIFDVKRLIGRDFNDSAVQSSLPHFPYNVKNINGKSQVEVVYQNVTRLYSPEQISSMILQKMRQTASSYLGCEVTDAVITVPAYFNDAQRQATKDAGHIAGLNVLRIINEPTAAALAYGLDKISDKETNVLIFDFGGGTHDVTLLSLEDGLFQVRATSGNAYLGGEDIDNRLVNWCSEDFKRRYKLDLTSSAKALRRLRTACERAKRTLSTTAQTTVDVDSLYDGIDYNTTISRAKFEELCMDLFRKTMEPVNQVMQDSKLDKSKINEIVLVGGSTRIPKVRQMLSDYFNGKKLNESVNPDEAVAYGAAVQAAVLSGIKDTKLDSIVLVDVTPLSLGLETAGGIMTNIVDRNSTVPCKKSKTFSTYSDNQPAVTITIFEGERKFTRDNHQLGTFNLEGISPARRGEPQIEVTFDVDANGILNVTALEKSSGKTKNITITNNRGRFSEAEINKMVEEARQFEAADTAKKEAVDARNDLENYVSNVKNSLTEESMTSFIDSDSRTNIEQVCNELSSFIDLNTNESRDVYSGKKKILEDLWNPIVSKMYANQSQNSTSETNVSDPKVEEVD